MVDQENVSSQDFVASPTTNKAGLSKEISEIEDRYELLIRQLFGQISAERDAVKMENVELKQKLRDVTQQMVFDANVLTDFKEKAVKEIAAYRQKCQQLEEKLRIVEDVQAANDAVNSAEANEVIDEVLVGTENTNEDELPEQTEKTEQTEQTEQMVLGDSILLIDD